MDSGWQKSFGERMHAFQARLARTGGEPLSIKIRVSDGCFHRSCSPRAYELIDRSIRTAKGDLDDFAFVEHESGPELLIYVAAGTAVISLAKSVIDLIISILRARVEGVRKGDRPSEPLELIVRQIRSSTEYKEEIVLRISKDDTLVESELNEKLINAIRKVLGGKEDSSHGSRKRKKTAH